MAKAEPPAKGAGLPRTRTVLFVLALLPVARFAEDYFAGGLASPWRSLIQDSGDWSMRFLVASVCLSPFVALTRVPALNALRRMIGLFGAFYAAVHLFAWARQYGYDWPFLFSEALLRLYLTIGLLAAFLLVPLAATSPGFMHRWLGTARWRRVHALLFPAVLAAFVHYAMARGLTRAEVVLDAALIVVGFGWRWWPERTPAKA